MKYFINKFLNNNSSSFSSVIETIDKNNVLVVGEEGNNGLIVKVDENGDLLWGNSYSIRKFKVSFHKYIEIDNNEFIIYGKYVDGKNGAHHLLMRMDSSGQPIWVRRISTDKTRFNISIAKIGKEIAFTGWHAVGTDKIEIHKINLQGDLTQSVILDLGGDDQVLAMISLNNSLVLVGGTSAGKPWDGFLTVVDSKLSVVNSYLFNHPNDQSVEDIQGIISQGLKAGSSSIDTFLLGTSRIGTYTHTFLSILLPIRDVTDVSNRSFSFDVTNGNDRNIKFIHIDTDLFILGYNNKTKGNYVVRLRIASSVRIVWAKTFELDESSILSDIKLKNKNELWFSGRLTDSNKNKTALLIKTDFNLTTCKTFDLENVAVRSFEINMRRADTVSTSVESQVHAHDINVQSIDITKHAICDGITITEKSWIQSPYLYLQSAGSLGKDAAKGFLLRWFLLGKLGDTHLPKGDEAGNTDFFNKPDDYVRIYRTGYDIKIQQTLDFKNSTPIFISDLEKRWVYKIGDSVYYLNYKDEQKYASASAAHDPTKNPYAFLIAYGDGLLELEIRENLAFSVEIDAINNQSGEIKVETFSVQGNAALEDAIVSSRHSFKQLTTNDTRVVAENIQKIIFQIINADLLSFEFEMYADFITEKANLQAWTSIGKFALSKDTNEVYLRLEDSSRFNINGHWQKYNEDAFVNVQNYRDRWSKPQNGLSAGVEKFIELSDTDPAANKEVEEEIDKQIDADAKVSMSISYFDLLQLASTDFHIARMLGLGTIDTSVNGPKSSNTEQYVYLAEYVTLGGLDGSSKPDNKQHLFLTLPTALIDERLPQTLEILPVTYGINLYKGTPDPFQLTDANGYVPYEAVRYINVNAKTTNDYSDYQGFFQPSIEFTLSDFSPPVFAGIEYRKQGEVDWRKPEISHDQAFKDAGIQQNPETLPVPFQEDSKVPLLIHDETEQGIHEYAAYSINIFSRASQVDNSVFTDLTQFVKPNTLLPPHNLHVQLIQKENPNILTTTTEQAMLKAIQLPDKMLVRLTFLYSHLHDINYGFGNKIKIFFREELPRNIMGGIGVITDDVNDQYALVSTQAYTYNSTGQPLIPNVPPALINNFIGGVLVANEKRYHIEDIVQTNSNGDYPKFKIKKQEDRNINYSGNGNHLSTTQTYLTPDAENGDLFMVIENMALSDSWTGDNPVGLAVDIGDASWATQIDSYVNDENVTIENELRGIWDSVTITPKIENINNVALPLGYYDVIFDSYRLNNHPQYKYFNTDPDANSVNWHKGIIRIPIQDNSNGNPQKKAVDVVSIENIGNNKNLKLVIHDESYENESDETGTKIKEGTGIAVNFYPGYRVYLHAEKSGNFNSSTILPQLGEGTKKTIIGLSSVDTATQDSAGNDYHSNIGVPQILFGREILEPEPPQLPSGPDYATPPDFYGKSTYTFTTEFRKETFAAIFYRADMNAILKALYKKDTLITIKETILPSDEDEFFSDRLNDIVSFAYQGTFKSFPLLNGDYTFPNPDNTDNKFDENGSDNPSVIIDLIKDVVINTFLPLTEQPLIYAFIKGGNYLPIPKKQTIRDKYGELLDPSDPDYDLSPMAKRIDGEQTVRFTDFTLDGEMSKNTAYFYCVREMGNSMSLSEPSPIMGPVQLINKNPPEAPVIRKITSQLANLVTGENTAVNFDLNEYPVSQNIRFIQIYRSTSAVDAMTPRTMTLVKEIDLEKIVINDGIIQVQDDFENDVIPPYGDTLYYKLIALREVKYTDIDEQFVVDLIPSRSSKTLLTNVVDVFNPEPPLITKTEGIIAGKSIVDLELQWNKTAYNAKYYLFKMNSAGNWNKVFEIMTNDQADLSYRFPDPIQKFDDENDDKEIYHRFKVTVENASGLLNTEENILTI